MNSVPEKLKMGIRKCLPTNDFPKVPIAGRLKHFSKAWKKLTRDQSILDLVDGYVIPFQRKPFQSKTPFQLATSREQQKLMDKEVKEMLKKGAIRQASTVKGEFLSNLFLVKKKNGGQRPVINLKHLNAFIPYNHFKMEGLQNLRYLLQEGDYIDLKDAYYCVPLQKNSRKYVRFRWSGNLYEFLCLCFGLGPAPRISTKLLKIPIAILRRINMGMIIYLDDMLLMGHSIEEISMCRDTVIFLLQHLGFVINWKKSVLTPVQEIEFLGLKINSVNLEISLTEEKIQKVKTKCQNLLTEPETSILELTRVIGLLTSTIQAVLPARLQCRYLQLQQISSLKESHSYQQKIVLNHQSKTELLWWITNLDLCNGRSLIQPPAQVLIQTDASTKGWGATCNGISTGGMWSAQEMKYHINILELLAVKPAIQTFTK